MGKALSPCAPRCAGSLRRSAAPRPRQLAQRRHRLRLRQQLRQHPVAAAPRPSPGCLPRPTSTCTLSRKFSMCGPNSTGFPCAAGSRMFCPPRVVNEPPTKTSVASRYARDSSPIVSSTTTCPPRSGSPASAAPRPARASFASAATRARRDRCTAARSPAAGPGAPPAAAGTPPAGCSSSPSCVLPAITPARPPGSPSARRSASSSGRAAARRQRVELRVARHPDPLAAAPPGPAPAPPRRPRASGTDPCPCSGLPISEKNSRYLPRCAGEKRPLVSTTRAPRGFAARMRLGQISVYSSTSRSGWIARTARRVAPHEIVRRVDHRRRSASPAARVAIM